MPAQANESSATQSPAVGNCQCQLMIYDPANPGFDPGEDFYQTPQSQIPPHFTEILAPIDPGKIHHGRFLLWNPYVENAPELPLEDWIIEAVDSHGQPANVLRFALYDFLGSGPEPQWGPTLAQGPTPCEAYVRFQFKVAEGTAALDDYYWIRAKWPRTAPNEQAVVCMAKVKFRESEPEPEEPEEEPEESPQPPGSIYIQYIKPPDFDYTPIPGGHLFLHLEEDEEEPECTSKIELDDKAGTADQHVASLDGSLGICIGVEQQACRYPSTVVVTIQNSGPTDLHDFTITSRIEGREDIVSKGPFRLKRLDAGARHDGSRKRGKPDGIITGKWKNAGWQNSIKLKEPCESEPLRVMVELTNDNDILQYMGIQLRGKIVEAAAEGDTESAWPDSTLNAWVQVRKGGPAGDVLAQQLIPIRPKGGVWVQNRGTGFAAKVLSALRELCGRDPKDASDFDWLDGIVPRSNHMNLIVPKVGFCPVEGEQPAPNSWKNALAHAKGRELVGKLLCGSCCAVIMHGGPDVYIPFTPWDSFPRGLSPIGGAAHWSKPIVDCSGQNRPSVLPGGTLRGIKGTGIGTGGVVQVQGTDQEWTVWAPDDGKWKMRGKQSVKAARVLAHELAHLVLGCSGKLLSGIAVPLDKVQLLFERPDDDDGAALARWEREVAQARNDFKKAKAQGNFRGLPYDVLLDGFHDLGEYDAILLWENDIAQELGELPRFSHG